MSPHRTRSELRLLDEHSEPPLRGTIGRLLRASHTADVALSRIRLAALDLTPEEMRGPRRCRVLLGQLDASSLHDRPGGATRDGPAIGALLDWLASGRLEVRSAGIGGWNPDFSLYETGRGRRTALLGAHYFVDAGLAAGPLFTFVVEEPTPCDLLARRFEEVWARAHDVAPAIAEVLERVERDGTGPGVLAP